MSIMVNWKNVIQRTTGKSFVFAIDIAKVQQYAVLMANEHQPDLMVKWIHPVETPTLLAHLATLSSRHLEIGDGAYVD